jgi:ureidoacrylate peracid hydrolase
MHKIDIPQYVIDRVKARRPGLTLFAELDSPSTALTVVDLQNAFMRPGMPGEIPFAREIVSNVNVLAEAVRRKGGRVVTFPQLQRATRKAGWRPRGARRF